MAEEEKSWMVPLSVSANKVFKGGVKNGNLLNKF